MHAVHVDCPRSAVSQHRSSSLERFDLITRHRPDLRFDRLRLREQGALLSPSLVHEWVLLILVLFFSHPIHAPPQICLRFQAAGLSSVCTVSGIERVRGCWEGCREELVRVVCVNELLFSRSHMTMCGWWGISMDRGCWRLGQCLFFDDVLDRIVEHAMLGTSVSADTLD